MILTSLPPSAGDLLIVIAQVVTATQMVVEEKFLYKYNIPPLLAVGWEGNLTFYMYPCTEVVIFKDISR